MYLPLPTHSFTLATNPQGLTPGDTADQTMAAIKQAGLTNYYVNLMTMDYGAAACPGPCNMGAAAVHAAKAVSAAYNVPLSRIEVTPMIGMNDQTAEVFTLPDLDTVTAYAVSAGLGGVEL
jgi:hypothetical protein